MINQIFQNINFLNNVKTFNHLISEDAYFCFDKYVLIIKTLTPKAKKYNSYEHCVKVLYTALV